MYCVKPYFYISQLCEFVIRQENIVAYIWILGTGTNSCPWLRHMVKNMHCRVCHLEHVHVWVCRMGVLNVSVCRMIVLSGFGCKLVVLANKWLICFLKMLDA